MSKRFTYIDIHGHVQFPEYDMDREVAIERARKAGVAMITVGTDIQSSAQAVQLAVHHEHVWAVVGIHPTESIPEGGIQTLCAELERLAHHPKVIAIGECGLDYLHTKPGNVALQKELFRQQVLLAQKIGKPLMLHVRNGKSVGSVSPLGNAYADVLHILSSYPNVCANFHFFAGSQTDLQEIMARGYYISCTGVISFTHDYDDLIKMVPLSRLMSETDCPFVAPVPYRGTRNEPLYVIETVKAVARIKGEDVQVVAEQLVHNARSFFGI